MAEAGAGHAGRRLISAFSARLCCVCALVQLAQRVAATLAALRARAEKEGEGQWRAVYTRVVAGGPGGDAPK